MAYYGGEWYGGGGGMFPWGRGAGGGGIDGAGGSGSGSGVGGARTTTLAALMATRASAPSTIRRDAVRAAEGVAREVLLRLHPTEEAERRRQGVIAYLKRVIGSSLGCEVFAFGSVPLKTYLPDGDVDITVLGNTWLNSTFMDGVRYVLEAEKNCDAEFELTGLNFINAEVKLIKCVIDNIVVDVSFNQIGGVSTFCFLELVDRQVGENHLFKRSIMLIKAWCYHESRILGAHHGLISTYALETLVLYIFNMFHNSLHGPLEVLYRFLEYFSKFDWDQYGISLNGPVDLSSLPNLSVEPTAVHDELLLGKEFLQGSLDRLVVIPDSSDGCDTNFRTKYLNIIDPLKGNNNLGRSVSKASFYRIRSAFSFGAQKLGQILMLPSELIPDEICGFFANTLKRHGKGERPDLGDYSSFESLLGPENALNGEGSSFNSCTNEDENRSPCHSSKLPDKESNVADMHKNSGRYLPGDVQDLPWNKIWFMEYASDFRANSSNLASFRSHSSFSRENGNCNSEQCFKNYATEEDLHLISRLHMPQQIFANHHILATSTRTNTLDFSNSCPVSESDWTAFRAEKKPLPSFSQPNMLDLSGDLDLHLGCLRKVQYHLECLFDELLQAVQEACLASVLDEDSFQIPTVSLMSNTDTRPPRLSLASSTDSERRKLSSVYCSYSTGDVSQQPHAEDQVDVVWWQNVPLPSNGLALSSSLATNSDYYPVYWFSDSPKTRGTGTYIPKISYNMYKERMTPGRGIMPERGRKLKQRLHDRQYSSLEQGCSGPGNEHTTKQMPMKQNSSQQDGYSSKSSVPKGGFVHFREQVAIEGGTKPVATNLPKVQNNQGIASSPAIGYSTTDFVEKGRQPKSSSSGIVLPQLCQGNPPVSNTCQPSSPPAAGYCQLKVQVEENLEFGSLGPFSLGLLSAQFKEEFPPLPATKRPAEVPLRTSKASAEVPASTVLSPKPVDRESRPQDVYQLKDEADFPPLQAGYR